ncbi:kinase-like domain-containing protein [Hypoxylon rubiginosum]|uniref:Kinase-like domain-containing protein n=1 Tax=Hypoxylon rubiginosum TaxID=110542 RepID=A0ACC0CKB6_9PEZI|nr:kinase-like domain-containing protein [Hypoxylon rubiginosum]
MSIIRIAERLPTKPQEISSTWLNNVLCQNIQHFEVTSTVLDQTAGKVFVTIEYDDGSRDKLCLKGSFSPDRMAMKGYGKLLAAMYTREVDFFTHVAPALTTIRLLKVWWAGANIEQLQAIVVMGDLREEGYRFGSALEAWPIGRVAAGVEQLAALHADTWNKSMEDYPWLTSNYEEVMIGLTENWDQVVLGPGRPPVPASIKNKEQTVAAMKKHFATKNPQFLCLVHGDPHPGNTFIDKDDKPGFLDWQTVHIGSAFHDVAYFVVGALSIEDRRKYELSILHYYLVKLATLGGPTLTTNDERVTAEYKKSMMAGMGWILTPYEMQREECVMTMVKRYSAALEDHNVIALVESLSIHRPYVLDAGKDRDEDCVGEDDPYPEVASRPSKEGSSVQVEVPMTRLSNARPLSL